MSTETNTALRKGAVAVAQNEISAWLHCAGTTKDQGTNEFWTGLQLRRCAFSRRHERQTNLTLISKVYRRIPDDFSDFRPLLKTPGNPW
jgi:hypothetical protein